jgi:hypothetical protein
MKITEAELRERTIPVLTVRSVTMSVCTVEVELHDGTYVLCDSQGKVMRFNGVDHARNALEHLQVQQALLIHDSPYAEMVGQPEERSEPIRVPLGWG